MSKMRILLVVIGFLIVSTIMIGTSIIAYNSYVQPERYVVQNDNTYFTIQKAHPDVLNYYMNTWNVWRKDGITGATPPGKHTVKKIDIQLTDEIQKDYSVTARGNQEEVLVGAGSYVGGKNLLIKIYINKDANVFTEDVLNKNVLFVTMSAIFDAAGGNGKNDKTLIAAIDAFYNDVNVRPFIVKAK